jgi:hypothetical protein
MAEVEMELVNGLEFLVSVSSAHPRMDHMSRLEDVEENARIDSEGLHALASYAGHIVVERRAVLEFERSQVEGMSVIHLRDAMAVQSLLAAQSGRNAFRLCGSGTQDAYR